MAREKECKGCVRTVVRCVLARGLRFGQPKCWDADDAEFREFGNSLHLVDPLAVDPLVDPLGRSL